MDGPDFPSATTALFTAISSYARAVEQLSHEPLADALWQQDPRIGRMAGELAVVLGELENEMANGRQEENFLQSLRSAKARYRRLRDLMVDKVVAATSVPDYPPAN